MKKDVLNEIIEKKKQKIELAIVTYIECGESFVFIKDKPINDNFKKYSEKINFHFDNKKNGIIEDTNIFIEIYIRPIQIFIVGAVHVAQYLVNFVKNNSGFFTARLFDFLNIRSDRAEKIWLIKKKKRR